LGVDLRLFESWFGSWLGELSWDWFGGLVRGKLREI